MIQILHLLIFPLLGAASDPSTGLLITGGMNSHILSTSEFWSPPPNPSSCVLPYLPSMMAHHTIDRVGDKLVLCYRKACSVFSGGEWSHLADTIVNRHYHTSAVVGDAVLLVGGEYDWYTTELVSVDGGESQLDFQLDQGRFKHCSIQTSETSMVLTGGDGTLELVTQHTGLGQGEGGVVSEEMPSLITGRKYHACGSYQKDGKQMLIVTGGFFGGKRGHVETTEVFDFSLGSEGTWREGGPLPTGRNGLRGATIGGVFHVCGGYSKNLDLTDILSWDSVTESWTMVGEMRTKREYHAVLEVSKESVSQWCD